MHAADHDHRQQLAGKRHRDRLRRHQVGLEAEQRAGQSRHHGRNDEHAKLVAFDRIALKRGAQLVLADRHQHMAEWRAHDAQQHIEHNEPNQRHRDVEGKPIVEVERSDIAAARQATQSVLAAGHFGPAERDGVGQRRQRQRQQREIDPTPAQDDDAHEGRQHGDHQHRQ